MKSIYFRNFLSSAVVICLNFVIIAVCAVLGGKPYVESQYRGSIRTTAEETVALVAAMSEEQPLENWQLSMYLSALGGSTGNQVMLTDAGGGIRNCSERNLSCIHLSEYADGEYLDLADDGAYLTEGTLGGVLESNSYICIAPIRNDNGLLLGYVIVSSPTESISSTWSQLLLVIVLVIFGVMVVGLAASLAFSKAMAKPLDEMAAAARQFALGNYSVRVEQEADPSEEVGALIESFNSMADAIEQNEKRRSEFVANVSHELRTPMTTIAGFADGILDGTIPQEEQKRYLVTIRDETRRLARLVRDMLDASRAKSAAGDESRRTVFDISELTIQILLSFESRAMAKGLDVDPQLPDNQIMVRADKDSINRVIYNLLDNAVKFARLDSCITIRVYKDSGKAYVCVKDEGETIPPDDLPLIFDRFHKSDRSRGLDKDGVGLGLYLVKSIINSHGEDIAVRSEDGITEFVFTLPLA